ncbi:hypothetical protein BKA56DRAFT_603084 [Ilyonectria sp. MPI-CAGE-AT-0026]|nr:hypothetical protein BKA56DRAFT_603084 [Ilyonectria sp. MPI-CAGE-AT-0026]
MGVRASHPRARDPLHHPPEGKSVQVVRSPEVAETAETRGGCRWEWVGVRSRAPKLPTAVFTLEVTPWQ